MQNKICFYIRKFETATAVPKADFEVIKIILYVFDAGDVVFLFTKIQPLSIESRNNSSLAFNKVSWLNIVFYLTENIYGEQNHGEIRTAQS